MAWHNIPYMSNKRHTFNILNLIATFVFFIGLVGFIVSFANLFHQWDVLSNIKTCFEKAHTDSYAYLCREYFYQSTGQALNPDRFVQDQNINVIVSFWPLMYVLLAIIVMLLGIFTYNIGNNWHTLVKHHIYKDFSKDEMPNYLDDNKEKKTKK